METRDWMREGLRAVGGGVLAVALAIANVVLIPLYGVEGLLLVPLWIWLGTGWYGYGVVWPIQTVAQLSYSRADTVDAQAAELRRIERDLHDGAQARLVSLGMTIGLAEELVGRDPETARRLLAEAGWPRSTAR